MVEFTPAGYERMLSTALALGFSFRDFTLNADPPEQRTCLLRHDIDADLGAAATIAEIESRLGVRATYFVMFRSPLYNPFSRSNHRLIERIMSLGHDIGLHFDQGFVGGTDVQEDVDAEVNVFNRIFDASIRAVSFHQPGPAVLAGAVRINGYVNTYDRDALGNYHYLSDTNKSFRGVDPMEIFRVRKKLQLLLHPLWWVETDAELSPEELWNRAIVRNVERAQQQLLETERAFGSRRQFSVLRA